METRQLLTESLSIEGVIQEEGTDDGPPTGYIEFSFPVTYSGDVCPGGFDVDWNVAYPTSEPIAEAADIATGYTSGTIHFDGLDDPGGEVQYVVVRVLADDAVELNEQFYVDISNVSVGGITIATSRATGTIENDDEAVITTQLTAVGVDTTSVDASEGNTGTNTVYSIQYYLSNSVELGPGEDITFDFDFVDAFATQGTDYTVLSDHGTVTGVCVKGGVYLNTATFVGDNTVELDEGFFLRLSNLQTAGRNVRFGSEQATHILSFDINNDDTASVLIFVKQGYSPQLEGNSGTKSFIFIAKVDKAVDVPFTVSVSSSDGTATIQDGDYQNNEELLEFDGTVGEEEEFTVLVNGDTTVEGNESFLAVLGDIYAANHDVVVSPSTGSATAWINNDDP